MKRNRMLKFLSIFLAAGMLFTSVPADVYAAKNENAQVFVDKETPLETETEKAEDEQLMKVAGETESEATAKDIGERESEVRMAEENETIAGNDNQVVDDSQAVETEIVVEESISEAETEASISEQITDSIKSEKYDITVGIDDSLVPEGAAIKLSEITGERTLQLLDAINPFASLDKGRHDEEAYDLILSLPDNQVLSDDIQVIISATADFSEEFTNPELVIYAIDKDNNVKVLKKDEKGYLAKLSETSVIIVATFADYLNGYLEDPNQEEVGISLPYLPANGLQLAGTDSATVDAYGVGAYGVAELPSSYKTADVMTLPGLKNQGSYGTCYAHATMAVSEINMMKKNSSEGEKDYSERHIAYMTYNINQNNYSLGDPLGGTNGDRAYRVGADSNIQIKKMDSGNTQHTSNVLMGWVGAADESVAPYTAMPNNVSAADAYNDAAHLQSYYVANIVSDRSAAKELIKNYGAVTISYKHNALFYSNTNNSYYNYLGSAYGDGHAISCVGWDDDFSASNFNTAPEGDGAWLMRNSWWSDSDEEPEYSLDGYFWMSYYDKSLEDIAIAYDMEPADNYDNNYQYDGTWANGSVYFTGSSSMSAANIFTAKACNSGEKLKAVSFRSDTIGQNYTIEIYKNLTNTTNPTSGTKVTGATVSGITNLIGYYSVPLATSVDLNPGEKFSVVVNLSCSSGAVAKIGIEAEVTNASFSDPSKAWYNTKPSAKSGQSFVCAKPGIYSWEDYGESSNVNVRIKAYTVNNEELPNNILITFNANGGSLPEEAQPTKTVSSNSIIGELPVPVRKGYIFDGWYKSKVFTDSNKITSETLAGDTDITVYAKWNVIDNIKVTFDPNGGTISSGMAEKTLTYDTRYGTLPSAIRAGYTFNGWEVTDPDTSVKSKITATSVVKIDTDHVALAQWKGKTIRISFDTDGGVAKTQVTVEVGNKYSDYSTIGQAQKAGYTFDFWYIDNNKNNMYDITDTRIDDSTVIENTVNHTLVAKYQNRTGLTISANQLAGSYDEDTEVELYTYPDGADIYYTLDGTVPSVSENGVGLITLNGTTKAYDDVILLSNGTETDKVYTLKAFAKMNNYDDSAVTDLGVYTIKGKTLTIEEKWGEVVEEDRTLYGGNPDNVPRDLWTNIDGITDEDYVGTAITYPGLRVYSGKKLLTEKVDYTVRYANNIKASTDRIKATVTVTGKGNYAGTFVKTFDINPLPLGEESPSIVNNANIQVSDLYFTYSGKLQKGVPVVRYTLGSGQTVLLRNNVDYTLEYPGTVKNKAGYDETAFVAARTHNIIIRGKGNYTGVAFAKEIIDPVKIPLNKVTVKGVTAQKYTEEIPVGESTPVAHEFTVADMPKFAVTYGRDTTLTEGTDFTISYRDNILPGTATIVLSAKEGSNFLGTKEITFKISGTPITGAIVTGITPFKYDGTEKIQPGLTLTRRDKVTLIKSNDDGVTGDYTVTYLNNVNVGRATIIITGINGYTGQVKKTFNITAAGGLNIVSVNGVDSSELTTLTYQKGGVKPSVAVKDEYDNYLEEGIDYTITYKYNKASCTSPSSRNLPTVTVKGKGNYAGATSRNFLINQASISDASFIAQDVVFAMRTGVCRPAYALYDTDGAKLSALDYDTRSIKYYYIEETEVYCKEKQPNTYRKETRSSLAYMDAGDIIPAGTRMGMEISAKAGGNYTGTTYAEFRIVTSSLSTAAVTINKQYVYSDGGEIKIPKSAITVKVKGKAIDQKDFKIVGYSNNFAKGRASVTIRGVGNYGGEKTVYYNISTRNLGYTVEYLPNNNGAAYTGTLYSQILANGGKITTCRYRIVGKTFKGWNTKADGSGISVQPNTVFKASDFGIRSYGSTLKLYAIWE